MCSNRSPRAGGVRIRSDGVGMQTQYGCGHMGSMAECTAQQRPTHVLAQRPNDFRMRSVGRNHAPRDQGGRCEGDNTHIQCTNEEAFSLLKRPGEVTSAPVCWGLGDLAPDWRDARMVCTKRSVGLGG